jgi:hypothetical protein
MNNIKAGDRVRLKYRPDWPIPAGYKLVKVEGTVSEVFDEPKGYIRVLLDKDGNTTGMDTCMPLPFKIEAVEKV